jgi:hypothetical protein
MIVARKAEKSKLHIMFYIVGAAIALMIACSYISNANKEASMEMDSGQINPS